MQPSSHDDIQALRNAIDNLSRIVEPLPRLVPQMERVIRLIDGEDDQDDRSMRKRLKDAETMLARHERFIGPVLYLGGPALLIVVGLVVNAIWRTIGGP